MKTNMSFVSDLIPTNLNEEKEKFFADNTYNPQFMYKTEISEEKPLAEEAFYSRFRAQIHP